MTKMIYKSTTHGSYIFKNLKQLTPEQFTKQYGSDFDLSDVDAVNTHFAFMLPSPVYYYVSETIKDRYNYIGVELPRGTDPRYILILVGPIQPSDIVLSISEELLLC